MKKDTKSRCLLTDWFSSALAEKVHNWIDGYFGNHCTERFSSTCCFRNGDELAK